MKEEIKTVPKIWHWYKNLTPKEKRNFRENVLKRISFKKTAFYNWLKNKFAPAIVQPVLSALSGIAQSELYKPVKLWP
jgi:hypothetical protein